MSLNDIYAQLHNKRKAGDSHSESSCYAKTTVDGDSLDSSESEDESDDESEEESGDEVYDDTCDRMVKKRRR